MHKEETYEEQLIRVLKEMVLSGEVEMTEGEDGELHFKLATTPIE